MQLASSGLTAAGLHRIDALVLATPFLIFHLYALGLRVSLVIAASVIVCHCASAVVSPAPGEALQPLDPYEMSLRQPLDNPVQRSGVILKERRYREH
jgi:hypothetical protein